MDDGMLCVILVNIEHYMLGICYAPQFSLPSGEISEYISANKAVEQRLRSMNSTRTKNKSTTDCNDVSHKRIALSARCL